MTDDRSPPLDALAEALRILDAASTYSFDVPSGYQAALAHVGDLDGEQLRQVIAAMAMLTGRYARLETLAWRYDAKIDFDTWVNYIRSRVAVEERP